MHWPLAKAAGLSEVLPQILQQGNTTYTQLQMCQKINGLEKVNFFVSMEG
jgi:hypothetical protein